MTTITAIPSTTDEPPLLGGRYRITRELARGGMGKVLEAEDVVTGENVAVKLLLDGANRNTIDRFVNEARTAAKIASEHVVRVLDAGALDDHQCFLVMELLHGEDLSDYLRRRGPLPLAEVATYLAQTCDALARAHEAGIVHRDIKPSNLFRHISDDGSVVVKVLDFGISKSSDAERTLTTTGEGRVLGSPPYMSPEQVRDPKRVDHRTDLWSLGVTAYRLLTGELPFEARGISETFAQILGARALPSLEEQGFPRAVDEVLGRCVAADPADRWPSARALGDAFAGLATLAHDPTSATRGRATVRDLPPVGFGRRARRALVCASGVTAILAIGLSARAVIGRGPAPVAGAPIAAATANLETTPAIAPAPPTIAPTLSTARTAIIDPAPPVARAPARVPSRHPASPPAARSSTVLQPNPYGALAAREVR